MSIIKTLFDDSDYQKKETPKEGEFKRQNIGLLKTYQEAVEYAFKKLHQQVFTIIKPNAMDRNLPSVSISSFIREYFITNMPFNCKDATSGRFKLTTETGEYIYLKRLYDNLMPSNIETTENDLILNQCLKPGDENKANIFLGYQTDDGYSNATGIFAVCIRKERIWAFDINSALQQNQKSLYVKIKNTENKPKLKEGIVRIKKNKNKNN